MISIKEIQSITEQSSEILRLTKKCLDSIEKDIIRSAKEGNDSVMCTLPNQIRGKNYISALLNNITEEIFSAGYEVVIGADLQVYVSWGNNIHNESVSKSSNNIT